MAKWTGWRQAVVHDVDEIHLLRKSFDTIERQAHVAALVFTGGFSRSILPCGRCSRPTLRTIAQADRECSDCALSLTPSRALEAELRELGARHAGYGVRDEHYATVGRACWKCWPRCWARVHTPRMRRSLDDVLHLPGRRNATGRGPALKRRLRERLTRKTTAAAR